MHRFGTLLVWLGLALTSIGLVFGFSAMLTQADSQAVNLLGLVPIGFIALLAGVVTVLFSRPGKAPGQHDRHDPD